MGVENKDSVDRAWSGGDSYERYMGRWSRAVARLFVRWLAVGREKLWVDVGCGTGALTQAIVELGSPLKATGVDPSGSFLDAARRMVPDPRAEFVSGNAENLPLPDASADAVASAFVLNFLSSPDSGVGEQIRVARPGGTVAAMVWDYGEGMAFLRRFWDAAVELDPEAREFDEGQRFPLCSAAPLERLFRGCGLRHVRVGQLTIETSFAGFSDFWDPFIGGPGPAPGYVASLDDANRERLRERLETSLETEADGSIALRARAWAVAGMRA